MRDRKTSIMLAVVTAAALLAAASAMADDPSPWLFKKCTICNWTIQTDGPVPCDGGLNTCITYNVSGSGTPDHLGVFLRAEATLLSTTGASTTTNPATCSGDPVFGLGSPLDCHERFVHFDNRQAKAVSFSLKVAGKRLPIITSVAVRKGYSQCAYPIIGIGLEQPPPPTACVSSCGNFSPSQSVRKTESFRFKNCEVTFEFDTTSGDVTNFTAAPIAGAPEGTQCQTSQGSVGDVFLNNPNIPAGNNNGVHGDGWLNSGNNSCATRFVGGTYYTCCF